VAAVERSAGQSIEGDGHAALVALLREAQGLVGERGCAVRLVLLRLRRGRRAGDIAARMHLWRTEPAGPDAVGTP
jgi:hypothetical protein